MTRIIYLIPVILLLGCDTPNIKSGTNSNSNETRLFILSVLDDVGDTIAKDFSFQIKLPLDTTFFGPVPHVISYGQFEMIDSLIVQEDMVSLRQYYQIRCAGDYVRLKRKIEI